VAQKFVVPITIKQLASAGSDALTVFLDGETYGRVKLEAGGRLSWSDGTGTYDTNLYRDSANVLTTDDVFKAPAGVVTLATNGVPTAALANGALAVDIQNHTFYYRSNNVWNEISGNSTITVSDTAPADPEVGSLWYDSTTLELFIYFGTAWVALIPDAGAEELSDLSDIDISSPTTGQVLKYDGAVWVNGTDSAGTTISSIDDINDVTITSAASGQFLKWNGTAWVNDAIDLGTDTTGNYMSAVTAGTGISVTHTPGEGSSAAIALNATLDNLSDVTITSPTNGQILKWNGTAWINDTDAGGSAINSLDDVADVTITSAASGQFLKWNGTAWVNDAIDLATDTTGSFVQSLVAGTGVTLANNSGENATPTITVDTSVIQARVTNVTDTEIGYLDGVTSAIQTQIDTKAPIASPTFTGTVSGVTATMVGLGNVDNTSNATERAATATLTNKTLTSPVINTPTGIVKGDVGLGSVDNTADSAKPVSTAQQTALDLKANLASPTFTGTVSGITKTMVGLGSVDNTADTAKPVSTAQQTALDLKANLASPTLTGTPTAPTASAGTNNTQVATTAYADAAVAAIVDSAPATLNTLNELADALGDDANFAATTATAIGLKAPIASPTFTGTVSGVTATMVGLGSVNNTADTAKPVSTAQQTALDLKANLASPTFTGTVTVPTPSNNTDASTKAYVDAAQSAAQVYADSLTYSISDLTDGVTANAAELNVLDGITASTAELNILDGVTSSTAELNILDGATLSTTELNYVDGVTSAIQTQLNAKAPLASPALTGTPTAPTAAGGTNTTQVATTAFVVDAVNTATAANTVELGTDTTGNYMVDVSAGTGISVTHTQGEGSTATVAINATLDNLSDVSVASPTTGQFLKWNGSAWVASNVGASVSSTAPTSPTQGQIWFYQDTAQTFVYYGTAWIEIGGSNGSARVQVSSSAPASPLEGDLWFDSDTAQTFAYYDSQWVEIGTGSVSSVSISSSPPASPAEGNMWFDSDTAQTFTYYDSQWVELGASGMAATISDTAPASPIAGQVWFNSSSGATFVYYGGVWVEVGVAPFDQLLSTLDAKGDLLVGTADNTVAKLAVGSASQVLAVDSSTATGLIWSTPATEDYYITNSGSGAYLINGVSNGTIHFKKGKKYKIVVNATGHPFWIQTVSGGYSSGNVYSTGITNGGTQNGTIIVELPQNAPDTLYYACQYHSSMAGSISTLSIEPDVKTQLDTKQAVVANVSDTEIGYLDGVTSAIQTQLNTKASTGKAIAMSIVFSG